MGQAVNFGMNGKLTIKFWVCYSFFYAWFT